MDEMIGAGRKELTEAEGIRYINGLEKIFIMYSAATGATYPAVDMSGSAYVFSRAEFAEYIQRKNAAFKLKFREMSLSAFKTFVNEWYAYGVCEFELNPGVNDVHAKIKRDQFMPNPDSKMLEYYGSGLNRNILRYRQLEACKGDNMMAMLSAANVWNLICHELYETVFLVPVSFDGVPDNVQDHSIHFTHETEKMLVSLTPELQWKKEYAEDPPDIIFDPQRLHAVLFNEKRISGSEGYHFDLREAGARTMHLRTISNGKISLLCAFTDIRDIHRIFGKNVHIALLTYKEIIARIDDTVSGGPAIAGLALNMGANQLILDRSNIKSAAAESKKQRKVYMPAAGTPAKPEAKREPPEGKQEPEETKRQPEEEKREPEETKQKPSEKKADIPEDQKKTGGFFGKLFGKRKSEKEQENYNKAGTAAPAGKAAEILQQSQERYAQLADAKKRTTPVSDEELAKCFLKYFAPNKEFYSNPNGPKYKAYFHALNEGAAELARFPSLFEEATGLSRSELVGLLNKQKDAIGNIKLCTLVFCVGEYAVIRDRVICVDFGDQVPYCIAIYLLLTAERQPAVKRSLLIDAGDRTDKVPLKAAIRSLKLLDPAWECRIL